MAQDEFFQGHPQPVLQDARAQSPDGPARDLDDTGPAVVDPQFGMDGSLRESHGRGSPLDGIENDLLGLFGQARRRNVYRLFEEGSLQGIGLVEQGEHAQLSVGQ